MSTLTIGKNLVIKAYQENPRSRRQLLDLFPDLFPTVTLALSEHLQFGVQGEQETKDLFIQIAKKLGVVYNEDFNSKNDFHAIYFSYYWNGEFYGPSYSYSGCDPIDLEEHFSDAITKLLEFAKPISKC